MKSELGYLHYDIIITQKVRFLLQEFDGKVVLELPPAPLHNRSATQLLCGMDQKDDGHAWCITITYNLKALPKEIKVKRVLCASELQCTNNACAYWMREQVQNDKYWDGVADKPFQPSVQVLFDLVFCVVCKERLFCDFPCGGKM